MLKTGRSAGIWLIVTFAAWIVWGCSGPQPLSRAIRPEERQTFLPAMQAGADSAKASYYEWKASQTGQTVSEVAAADEALSSTRNPFRASTNPQAVSRGAVIYQTHCASCHGDNVDGHGPAMTNPLPQMNFHAFAKRFAVTIHGGAPRAWFKKINEGFTSRSLNPDGSPIVMPAFKDVLAREQIWLAITYLQSLDIHAPASGPD